jgi:hypothetical protein
MNPNVGALRALSAVGIMEGAEANSDLMGQLNSKFTVLKNSRMQPCLRNRINCAEILRSLG